MTSIIFRSNIEKIGTDSSEKTNLYLNESHNFTSISTTIKNTSSSSVKSYQKRDSEIEGISKKDKSISTHCRNGRYENVKSYDWWYHRKEKKLSRRHLVRYRRCCSYDLLIWWVSSSRELKRIYSERIEVRSRPTVDVVTCSTMISAPRKDLLRSRAW